MASVNEQPKFDYGDTVEVAGELNRERMGTIVGINSSDSRWTYTVEFGDGSDAEIEEESLSKVNE